MPDQRADVGRRAAQARTRWRATTVVAAGCVAVVLVLALTGMGLAGAEPAGTAPAPGAVGPSPGGASEQAGAPAASDRRITAAVYRVRAGDTVEAVAALHATTVTAVVDHNGLQPPYRLQPGEPLHIPEPDPGQAAPTATTADGAAVRRAVERWADVHHLPPDLLAAVLWQESRWQGDALSHKGAMGVGQLMPETAQWVAGELVGARLDPWSIDDNVQMSAAFLRWLIDRAEGDHAAALAGYYQGPASIARSGWFDDTERYVGEVFAWRWQFRVDPTW